MNPLIRKIERKFQVPIWDEVVKKRAMDYWSWRNIVFSQTTPALIGKRGNFLANLTSFNMSKLMARLTITVSPQNEIHCVLLVNTVMQQITEWNRAWWDLEMETFESFLLRNDLQVEKWQQFGLEYKKAAVTWSLTCGLAGQIVPREEVPIDRNKPPIPEP